LVTRAIRNTNFYDLLDFSFNNPVPEDILKLIESSKIFNVKDLASDKKDCIICLEAFKNGEDVITVPCFHLYHKLCVLEWFKKNNACPICKHVLSKDELK